MAQNAQHIQAPRLPTGLSRRSDLELDTGDDEWAEVHVTGGDFSGQAAAQLDIARSRLTGVRFTGADVDQLLLTDTIIDDCDLSGAALGLRIDDDRGASA